MPPEAATPWPARVALGPWAGRLVSPARPHAAAVRPADRRAEARFQVWVGQRASPPNEKPLSWSPHAEDAPRSSFPRPREPPFAPVSRCRHWHSRSLWFFQSSVTWLVVAQRRPRDQRASSHGHPVRHPCVPGSSNLLARRAAVRRQCWLRARPRALLPSGVPSRDATAPASARRPSPMRRLEDHGIRRERCREASTRSPPRALAAV